MDPRIADRRRRVLESGARRGVKRALWVLGAVAVAGLVIWFMQSPFLDLDTIEVTGASHTDVEAVLAAIGVEVGMPMIAVRTGSVEEALLNDSWVGAASVRLVWPSGVDVSIDERTPAAWVWAGGRFALVDSAATVLEYQNAPSGDFPVVRLAASPAPDPGVTFEDSNVRGAVVFAEAATSIPGLQISSDGDELTAVGGGHRILLGRPVDMAAKAAALLAVLADGPPQGSEINLTAPARPAVTPATDPQPLPEG